ncbi:unnamed protein product [Adineta steineri]|uniref:G-protein coupled receptors family 1 profile domain-containing protein n=1 Tax=Adineta steineri TaxID=433720 RepID=A0A814HQL8_9BILA|nr:unnamed protein product [Adineta steineri]
MNKSEDNIRLSINIKINFILTILFLLIAIIGVLGNLLVIISVQIDSRMRRSLTNRLIVHVACCDLIILLLNIPDLIQFVSSTNGNWILNEIACKLIRSILVLAQYASVLTMCAVTIERFIGIVYPLRSKFLREEKHVAQITFFVWFFSLLCASPNLIYLRIVSRSPSHRSCSLEYSQKNLHLNQRGYIIHKSIESTIFYFIPLLLQIYCYTRIATQLFHVDDTLQTSFNLNQLRNNQRTQNDMDDEDDYIDNDENMGSRITIAESYIPSSNGRKNTYCQENNGSYSKYLSVQNNCSLLKSKHKKKGGGDYYHQKGGCYNTLKSRRGVIKMLFTVVLIYFVSFSPQVLIFILFDTNAIHPLPKFIQTPYFIAFTMLLITISSASNPIVYAIFCSKFRQSFAKVLRHLWFCDRSTYNCNLNQRRRSLQNLPKENSHINKKISHYEQKSNKNQRISIHINETNDQR